MHACGRGFLLHAIACDARLHFGTARLPHVDFRLSNPSFLLLFRCFTPSRGRRGNRTTSQAHPRVVESFVSPRSFSSTLVPSTRLVHLFFFPPRSCFLFPGYSIVTFFRLRRSQFQLRAHALLRSVFRIRNAPIHASLPASSTCTFRPWCPRLDVGAGRSVARASLRRRRSAARRTRRPRRMSRLTKILQSNPSKRKHGTSEPMGGGGDGQGRDPREFLLEGAERRKGGRTKCSCP